MKNVKILLISMCCVLCFPLEARAERVLRYKKVVALVIGVERYQDSGFKALPNAEVDAKNFARLMAGRGAEVLALYGPRATREAILSRIEGAAKRAEMQGAGWNLLLIYFAGHGTTRHGEGYLVPYDGKAGRSAGWITMGTLKQKAREMTRVRHLVLVLGSCFSGTVLRSQQRSATRSLARKLPASAWMSKALEKVTRVAITAGTADQQIPDGPRGQGSVFGNAVVNALTPKAGESTDAADYNKDGCVTTIEWFNYVFDKGKTPLNTPYYGRIRGDNQGTAVLCRRWPVASMSGGSGGATLGTDQETRCRGGDAWSCLSAGDRYLAGVGVKKNPKRANALFGRACKLDEMLGCVRRADSLRLGRGQKRDLTGAVSLYKRACKLGEMLGCSRLGQCYQKGKGVGKDLERANALFLRACDGGDLDGCTDRAMNMLGGVGMTRDRNGANMLLSRTCRGGGMRACLQFGNNLEAGSGLVKEINRANDLYRQACSSGHAEACIHIAYNYRHGVGLDVDLERSTALSRKACDAGVMRGCTRLGEALVFGQGIPAHLKHGVALYDKACRGGDRYACALFENARRLGEGMAADPVKANARLQQLCRDDVPRACAYLSNSYRDGLGVVRDFKKDKTLAQRACAGGDHLGCSSEARNYRGRYLISGDFYIRTSYRYKDVQWKLTRACKARCGDACWQLGNEMFANQPPTSNRFYLKGCELGHMESCEDWVLKHCQTYKKSPKRIKDYTPAMKRFKAGCDTGSPRACTSLAAVIDRGCTAKRDMKRVVALYKKACTAGYGRACHNLGQVYEQGNGVRRNVAAAARQYRLGCDRWAKRSCGRLAVLYERGKGVKKNRAQAKVFHQKACDRGFFLHCPKYLKQYKKQYEKMYKEK